VFILFFGKQGREFPWGGGPVIHAGSAGDFPRIGMQNFFYHGKEKSSMTEQRDKLVMVGGHSYLVPLMVRKGYRYTREVSGDVRMGIWALRLNGFDPTGWEQDFPLEFKQKSFLKRYFPFIEWDFERTINLLPAVGDKKAGKASKWAVPGKLNFPQLTDLEIYGVYIFGGPRCSRAVMRMFRSGKRIWGTQNAGRNEAGRIERELWNLCNYILEM
jgi:hypothetical protein